MFNRTGNLFSHRSKWRDVSFSYGLNSVAQMFKRALFVIIVSYKLSKNVIAARWQIPSTIFYIMYYVHIYIYVYTNISIYTNMLINLACLLTFWPCCLKYLQARITFEFLFGVSFANVKRSLCFSYVMFVA